MSPSSSSLRLPETVRPARPISVRVNAAAKRRLKQRHPWVFDAAISHQNLPDDDAVCGQVAVVYDGDREFLAVGLYDPTSPIRVRVLAHKKATTIDDAFFAARLDEAMQKRARLEGEGTTGYRVLHGENDGFPGLVVDRYAEVLVVKVYTAAWVPWLGTIIPLLRARLPQTTTIVFRCARSVSAEPALLHGLEDGQVILGALSTLSVTFTERGLRFSADPVRGQKTGFFLDQRDNRARVEAMSAGKRVLNVFAYSGGFSLAAARGGATEVVAIDRSAPANAEAEAHFALNADVAAIKACQHRTITDDAFDAMQALIDADERFDVVIVDPPSFAKAKEEIPTALHAYERLAGLGARLVRPGGTFVFASCSSRVDVVQLEGALYDAAAAADVALRITDRTAHACDHPIGFPEGRYLKCLYADVAG